MCSSDLLQKQQQAIAARKRMVDELVEAQSTVEQAKRLRQGMQSMGINAEKFEAELDGIQDTVDDAQEVTQIVEQFDSSLKGVTTDDDMEELLAGVFNSHADDGDQNNQALLRTDTYIEALPAAPRTTLPERTSLLSRSDALEEELGDRKSTRLNSSH